MVVEIFYIPVKQKLLPLVKYLFFMANIFMASILLMGSSPSLYPNRAMKKFLLTFLFTAAAFQASASVVTFKATGDGYCRNNGICSNTNTNAYLNNDLQKTINDWQAFSLGNVGVISSATLSIFENASYSSFYAYGHGDINFYLATGINYAGLQTGPSIGTIANGSVEPTDAYVNVALNAYGISQLNALRGQSFIIGGSNGGSNVDAFGFSNVLTSHPYLTLTTADGAAVPEPATLALLGFGLFGLAASRRKRST